MNKKYVTNDESKYPVEILRTDLKGSHPILIVVHRPDYDEVIRLPDDFRLFIGRKKPFIKEVSPYEDFKDGDRVMVRNRYEWEKMIFARIGDDGIPRTYLNGMDKWTSGGETTRWNQCRKPTPEELEVL